MVRVVSSETPPKIVEGLIRNWWNLGDERDGLHREIVKAHTALHEAVENWNSLVNGAADAAQDLVDAQSEEWQSSTEGQAAQLVVDMLDDAVAAQAPNPWQGRPTPWGSKGAP